MAGGMEDDGGARLRASHLRRAGLGMRLASGQGVGGATPRWQWVWAVGLVMSLFLGACTRGAVREAGRGVTVAGARVEYFAWPPTSETPFDWVWPASYTGLNASHTTITRRLSWQGANYGFYEANGRCVDQALVREMIDPYQWYRVRVQAPGYETGIFYRFHSGYEESCRVMDCERRRMVPGACHRQDFELIPRNTPHALLPDIIVDPRDLNFRGWQCAAMPSISPWRELVGLRVGVATANGGRGALHLAGVGQEGGGRQVLQRVDWSDGTRRERTLQGAAFEIHPEHDHIHFRDWVAMELVREDDGCLPRAGRPQSCRLGRGYKVSFCIMDYEPFDDELRAQAGSMQPRYPDPPTCDSLEQGLSPGWKDIYGAYLPGQVIVVGAPGAVPAAQTVHLEVAVDPDNRIEESNKANNLTRVAVATPESPARLCADLARRLDCSVPARQYSSEQQRQQCPDYLRFAGLPVP